ncbi:hypothetical protein [Adlercreutzia rubneri]
MRIERRHAVFHMPVFQTVGNRVKKVLPLPSQLAQFLFRGLDGHFGLVRPLVFDVAIYEPFKKLHVSQQRAHVAHHVGFRFAFRQRSEAGFTLLLACVAEVLGSRLPRGRLAMKRVPARRAVKLP